MTSGSAVVGHTEVFVDRIEELAKLEARLVGAIGGSGSVVLVAGEAGIGKTALVREFLRRARASYPALTYCRGRCLEYYGPGEGYLPFLDGLGALLVGPQREYVTSLLQTYAPMWCLQLPATTPTPASREALQQRTIGANKERMLRELCDALEAAAKDAPLVLLLEDLQWADASSVDLLHHLGNRISRQGLLVVGTYRSADLEALNAPLKGFVLDLQTHTSFPNFTLGPWSTSAIAEYLEARFGPHEIPPALSERLHEKTDGHPLFVTTLINYLCERGDIKRLGDHWGVTRPIWETDFETPENLSAVIRKSIETLQEDDRVALQYGSVMGREFLSTILAALLETDEMAVEERLDRLARSHRLIRKVGEEDLPSGALATRYRFANPLYAEVLYDQILTKRRQALHRHAAEQLERHYGAEGTGIAAQIALHSEKARDFAGAVKYRVAAGDKAADFHAHDESRQHYVRALDLLPKLPAREHAEHTMALYHKLGRVQFTGGRFDEAAASFRKMLSAARETGAADAQFKALAGLCNALFYSRRLEEMAVRAEEALQVALQTGSEALRVEALLLMGMILVDQGDLGEVAPLFEEVLLSARELGVKPALLRGLLYRGAVCTWQMEDERAVGLLIQARDLAAETRDGFNLELCHLFLARALRNSGRVSEALATLASGIEMAERNRDHFWLPRLIGEVATIHGELQDFESAIHNDRMALQMAREHGVSGAQASILVNLACDHTAGGDIEEVPALFAQIESVAPDALLGWIYAMRLEGAKAEYWLARGEPVRAGEDARRLVERATQHAESTHVIEGYRILAASCLSRGDLDGAAAAIGESLARLRDGAAPLLAWKVHAVLGEIHARTGDTTASHEEYGRAAACVAAIAAAVQDDALRARFLGSPAVQPILEASVKG